MRFGRDMRHRVSALNVTFRKISTGLRVTRAADDASGMGIAERLKSQIMETQEEIRGSTDQISMLQTNRDVGSRVDKRARTVYVDAGLDEAEESEDESSEDAGETSE